MKLGTGVKGINQLTSDYSCLNHVSSSISLLILSLSFRMGLIALIVLFAIILGLN